MDIKKDHLARRWSWTRDSRKVRTKFECYFLYAIGIRNRIHDICIGSNSAMRNAILFHAIQKDDMQ